MGMEIGDVTLTEEYKSKMFENRIWGNVWAYRRERNRSIGKNA
jgi:hypothetical protein